MIYTSKKFGNCKIIDKSVFMKDASLYVIEVDGGYMIIRGNNEIYAMKNN
jgi:hypothetical protein